jgi:hypothetical protein
MKLPLNEYRRLRVDNGSLSALRTDRRWAEIKYVNYLAEIMLASKEPYMAARAAALRKYSMLVDQPNPLRCANSASLSRRVSESEGTKTVTCLA